MRETMMVGIALAFTVLLLFLRSRLFGRLGGMTHRVYLMNRTDGGGGPESDCLEEWPSVIDVEDDSDSRKKPLSEDERIELAVAQYRILSLLP